MPRDLRSRAATQDGPSTSGTQQSTRGRPPQKRKAPNSHSQRTASSDDESSDNEPVQVAAKKRTAPPKARRIEVPENGKKWSQKGFFDLPAIPNLNPATKDEDDEEKVAIVLVKLILLSHHSKLLLTNNSTYVIMVHVEPQFYWLPHPTTDCKRVARKSKYKGRSRDRNNDRDSPCGTELFDRLIPFISRFIGGF